MDPGAVRVGRTSEDGYAPVLVEVVAVVLASSTAAAYGPRPARHSRTSVGDLEAMIRDCIVKVNGKVSRVKRTLAVASKLRLRNSSFRLPTWRRPIFNSYFLGMAAAEDTTGEQTLDVWSSGDWIGRRRWRRR